MKLILKTLVTIAIFGVIFRRIEFASVAHILSDANFWLLGVSAICAAPLVYADGALWMVVMRALGHRVGLNTAAMYSLVGWFFSNIAPSTVGADIFRTLQMRRHGASLSAALRAVMTTRFTSFAALLFIIAGGLPFALSYTHVNSDRIMLIAIFAVCFGAMAGLLFIGELRKHSELLRSISAVKPIIELSDDLRRVLAPSRISAVSITLAAFQHLWRLVIIYFIARSLSVSIDFTVLFAFVPISLLIAMIPISLGSWGLREATFIYFLGLASVTPEAALSLSISFGFLRAAIGVIGGIAWMTLRQEAYALEVAQTNRN